MGGGLQNIAFIAGGDTPSVTGNTEEWNGSTWSEVNNLITARSKGGGAGNAATSPIIYVADLESPADYFKKYQP